MENVIILAPARSGSSMVAKIFLAHGLHLGAEPRKGGADYVTYEHMSLRAELNAMSAKTAPMTRCLQSHYNASHVRRLFDRKTARQPWCFKTGPQYFDILHEAFPEARYVLVMRNPESITQSQLAKSPSSRDVDNWTRQFVGAIDALHREHGFPVVQSEEVIDRDYTTLRAAFTHCGIAFDPAIAEQCIDRERWRF